MTRTSPSPGAKGETETVTAGPTCAPASDAIVAERDRLAKLVEAMIFEDRPGGKKRPPGERMALAIAASLVRRGRALTDHEKTWNLAKGLAEDDERTAEWWFERIRAFLASSPSADGGNDDG